jgi:hypothetical protein
MQRNSKTIRQGFQVLGRRHGDAFGNQVELDIRPSVHELQPRKLDKSFRNLAFDVRRRYRFDFDDMTHRIIRDRVQSQVCKFVVKNAIPSPLSKALIDRSKHSLMHILRSLGSGHALMKTQRI